jgi:hypothetical protein
MWTGYDFNAAEQQIALARVRCEAIEEGLRTEVLTSLGMLAKMAHS